MAANFLAGLATVAIAWFLFLIWDMTSSLILTSDFVYRLHRDYTYQKWIAGVLAVVFMVGAPLVVYLLGLVVMAVLG